VVFTNVTLDALADIAPTSLDELKRIPGIGPAKRERYGDAIVELIGAHVTT
jgi:DNA helicase II / ATP-dependent DNA helicase PcrA